MRPEKKGEGKTLRANRFIQGKETFREKTLPSVKEEDDIKTGTENKGAPEN